MSEGKKNSTKRPIHLWLSVKEAQKLVDELLLLGHNDLIDTGKYGGAFQRIYFRLEHQLKYEREEETGEYLHDTFENAINADGISGLDFPEWRTSNV